MGITDKAKEIKDKAKEVLSGDEKDEKVDKAAEKADEATGGKATGPIDQTAEKTKEGLDKLGE